MATQNVPTNYSVHNVQSYSTTARPPTSYDPAFSANSVAANYGYSSRTQVININNFGSFLSF